MSYIVVKYSPSGDYARFYAGGNEGPHLWTYARDKAFIFPSREAAQDAARTYSGAMVEETRS